jgi:hypothetical protein
LGEHTAEVLQRVLGVAPSEIASLHREGILFDAGLANTKQHRMLGWLGQGLIA